MLHNCYIIVLASGLGSRFGGTKKTLKQLTELFGKPILWYSLNTAISLVGQKRVILTYPPGRLKEFSKIVRDFGYDIRLIEGGERRQDTVRKAIESIDAKRGIVLIHDSARPLASKNLFKKVYECTKVNDACIPVVMASDTVKEVRDGIVKATLDRNTIAFSQTPQGFSIELLKRVYDVCDFSVDYTDEAMILESHGIKVHAVEGERLNLKITFSEDLDIIKALSQIKWKKGLD